MTVERYVAGAVALVLAAGSYFAIRRANREFRAPVEPVGLFMLAWCISLALFAIPWVRFTKSSAEAWIATYGAIAAFVIGGTILYRVTRNRGRVAAPAEEPMNARKLHLLTAGSLLLAWVGFAAFLHAVNGVLGWQKVFTDPQAVRAIQTSSVKFQHAYGPWKLLTYFGGIGALAWTIGIRSRLLGGRARVLAVAGPLAIVPYLFTTDRTQFVTVILWIALFHLVWRPVARPRRLLIAAAAVAVAAFGGFVALGARRGTTIAKFPDISARLTTQHFRGLALPYLYVTSGVPVFTRLIEDPNRPHTYGAMTFFPAAKLASALGIGGGPPTQDTGFYPVPFESENVATWLAPFYLDYGLAGCFVLPFLLGVGTAALARYALRRRTMLGAWLLSLVLLVTAATPVSDKFSDTITWELAALSALVVPFLTDAWKMPAFGEVRRLLGSATAGARVAAATTALVLSGAVGVAIAHPRADVPDPRDPTQFARILASAAVRADRAFRRFGYQAATALASQLRASDPAVNFQPLAPNLSAPPEPGTVGIIATPTMTVFRVATADGQTLELIRMLAGPGAGTYGPRNVTAEGLLPNGSFEPPLVNSWSIASGTVASARLDTTVARIGNSSLRVDGNGVSGTPSLVTESPFQLPYVNVGARYRLTVFYRTSKLSRPLAIEMKFVYRDGTYQFFFPAPHGPGRGHGIPAGTSRSWRTLAITGVAQAPLKGVVVFAVDTGTAPLTGTAWLDGLSLVAASS